MTTVLHSDINNKIKGMYVGAMMGDALGFPHESKKSKYNYTGKLEYNAKVYSQYQPTKVLLVGEFSDDSEMALTLTRSLILHQGFNRDDVLLNYMKWANSKPSGMGKNTKDLFYGVKTIKGYNNRSKKIFSMDISQSNGSLMRAWPLSILPYMTDHVNLSNPTPTCINTEFIYISLLRLILIGYNKDQIKEHIFNYVSDEVIKGVLIQSLKGEDRNIIEQRGWVLHGLYCAFFALFNFNDYKSAIDYIINKGGDVDTNACIAGAVLGAYYGFDELLSDLTIAENYLILKDVTSIKRNRPLEYSLDDLDTICNNMTSLWYKLNY
jgi:ADP-ribosylglycohydrolase